ncbi:MAG: hypothetical protein J5746_03995, partial [Victivallales bacterium]|nr:hypothetical protein [Victivallales bacterium]
VTHGRALRALAASRLQLATLVGNRANNKSVWTGEIYNNGGIFSNQAKQISHIYSHQETL